MVAKIFLLALSCIFIAQIHHVQCQNTGALPPEAKSKNEFSNVTASKTINAILRHLRIAMTHPVSAPLLRYISTAARVLLTNVIGQKNVQHFIDFIVGLLMDANTFVSMETFHTRLVQLAAAGRNAPIVLETAAVSTKRILDEPQLLEATDGFVDGINIMLDDMTVEKLRQGIARVKSMTKLASWFKPIVGIKIPTLQKRKKTDADSTGEELQSRDLGWVNNPALTMQATDNMDSEWVNNPALTMPATDNMDSVNTNI